MKKILLLCLLSCCLAACGNAKYYVRGQRAADVLQDQKTILIVENPATRDGFLSVLKKWLVSHSYQFTVVDEEKDVKRLPYLRYEGKWSWDMALYLRTAYVSLYSDTRLVGRCRLAVPNNLNPNKWDPADQKIENMMSLLFFHEEPEGVNVIYE